MNAFLRLVPFAAILLLAACTSDMGRRPADSGDDTPSARLADAKDIAAGLRVRSGAVTFNSSRGAHSGWLCRPVTEEKVPGLVVIHEWWGLNDNVKQEAEKLAAAGYVTLAVDLYGGEVATDPKRAAALKDAVKDDEAVAIMRGAVDFLSEMEETSLQPLGSIGWCFGGRKSLQLALEDTRVRACVVYYGVPETAPTTLQRIHGSVLGIFGDKDPVIPAASVEQFRDGLAIAGVDSEVTIYPGVGHAFANPSNKAGYNSAAAAQARAQTLRFLGVKLGSPATTRRPDE